MKYDEFLKMLSKEKVRRKPRHLESQSQQACVQWFRLAYPQYICMAIPNGGARNRTEAGIMKGEGVLAGASDLLIIAMRAVLFIEMKEGKGRQQESQKVFQQNVERLGHTYAVCYGLQDFQLTVERWLKERYGVYGTQV